MRPPWPPPRRRSTRQGPPCWSAPAAWRSHERASSPLLLRGLLLRGGRGLRRLNALRLLGRLDDLRRRGLLGRFGLARDLGLLGPGLLLDLFDVDLFLYDFLFLEGLLALRRLLLRGLVLRDLGRGRLLGLARLLGLRLLLGRFLLALGERRLGALDQRREGALVGVRVGQRGDVVVGQRDQHRDRVRAEAGQRLVLGQSAVAGPRQRGVRAAATRRQDGGAAPVGLLGALDLDVLLDLAELGLGLDV